MCQICNLILRYQSNKMRSSLSLGTTNLTTTIFPTATSTKKPREKS